MRVLKLIFGLILLSSMPAWAEAARIAVSANFRMPVQVLKTAFEAETPHQLSISAGASGQLFAQIVNGAPYDVFLSADQARPARLLEEGHAVAGSRFTYATGRLFLSLQSAVSDAEMPFDLPGIRRLSIANPRTAPYGAAASQVLQHLSFPDGDVQVSEAQSVSGVNAALAAGAVDAGFVAYASVAQDTDLQRQGWLVPDQFHDPIRQDAVLLKRAETNAAATAFMAWLKGPAAQTLIRQSGYDVD